MPRAGPRTVQAYTLEFKLTAVKLSYLAGVEVPCNGRTRCSRRSTPS